MTTTNSLRLAQKLALATPALLLAGAYISQYGFGLYPCEMCWWQRWPHFAALAFAALAFMVQPTRVWISLAALAIMVSGAIGAFHAGVEYAWWPGITQCSGVAPTGGNSFESIQMAPLIRCDVAPWSLFGISLAGWNFLFSTLAGLSIFTLVTRKA
ncbi:disulfide bond formation protein B [Parerythrobacter aestuarii]|uniref:disulfide bond formation protein B n=1 Tax=Parerythrobacter aestuarii TaxID=3020909 RepID=UPI0024DE0F72|nr:disulfide bond formation protein B [Parerythrobacter aestuarii]